MRTQTSKKRGDVSEEWCQCSGYAGQWRQHLPHITAGGVATNLVWAWHLECLPSAAKSHKVITCLWLGPCELWGTGRVRVRVSELALSVVTCQPLIVAAVNIYTSSLSAAPPSYNKMSRGAGVPVTRHTGWAEVRIMIGAVLKYSSSEDTLGWV